MRLDSQIINADCLEVLQKLPNESIDCILTDPPYFGEVVQKWDNQWKNMTEFQQWVDKLGAEFKRVLKTGGSLYWFGSWKNIAYCQIELDKHLTLLNSLVWDNGSFTDAFIEKDLRKYSLHGNERCLFYEKSVQTNIIADYFKAELKRAGATFKQIAELFPSKNGKPAIGKVANWTCGLSNINKEQYLKVKDFLGGDYLSRDYDELLSEYDNARRCWNADKEAFDILKFKPMPPRGRIHPTQKPEDLIGYLIKRSTNRGDIVFDGFAGSMTVAAVCEQLGRRYICVEKDKNYFDAGQHRLQRQSLFMANKGQYNLFGSVA